MGRPALELAGHWVELGLSAETKISGRALIDDITWAQEVSGSPISWTQPSHLGGSGLTPSRSTKTLPATWLRRKGRERERKKNKQNPRTNDKSKPIQPKSHKEAYIYTLMKQKKEKKKKKYIYIYI